MNNKLSLALVAVACAAGLSLWLRASDNQDYAEADVSPLPGYVGNFVSGGGEGTIYSPPEPQVMAFVKREEQTTPPKANCSPQSIIYYAKKAPENFRADKKGLLYGVQTYTNATAVDTPVGRFAGFNSCALVASSIMRKAGCRWMSITANAKAVYDSAYRNGWRPSERQTGGCIVAWNARWEGKRPRIGRGDHSKAMAKNKVMFRHVGVTTNDGISVDNSGILSAPSETSTYRPIRYEPPIFLCPNSKSVKR